MINRTKIICTIGPSVDSEAKIIQLVKHGMSVIRLNASHSTVDVRTHQVKTIRRVEARLNTPIGIMLDLQGPKLRVGILPHPVTLTAGDIWKLSTKEPADADRRIIPLPSEDVPHSVSLGSMVYMDDGLISAQVCKKNSTSIWIEIISGGVLESRKGLNIPYYKGHLPVLSVKDKQDLEWGLDHGVDFIALSFVRHAHDLRHLKRLIAKHNGKSSPLVIAKIEKPEAVLNMNDIIDESDGILVARGDLGIELPPERVPVVQKQLIEACRLRKKPVIIATQMLDSMRLHPRPTRAEVSDVGSAIYAGADALMLTGETSTGKYPIAATGMLNKIIHEVEHHMVLKSFRKLPEDFGVASYQDAFIFNVMQLADDIEARAIVMLTRRGSLTKLLSKLHPKQPVFSLASTEATYHQMTLYWGVFPLDMKRTVVQDQVDTTMETLRAKRVLKKGDRLIFRDNTTDGLTLQIITCH